MSVDVLTRALKRFDEIALASLEDRALAIEDRRFLFIAGAQWEGDWGAQFENCLRVQINKVQRGHDKIINDYRANRFTVDFRPVDDNSDDDTSDLLNGLMYADLYRSKGSQALDNAFGEGVAGGFGAWRLMNEDEDEYDSENDHQRIGIYQIPDADQRVFFDFDAKLYDKSDARFAYVLSSLSPDGFKEQYGEDRITSWPENRVYRAWFEWYRPQVVIVAEYYEVEETTEELRIYTRDMTGEEYRHWAQSITPEIAADYKQRGFSERKRRVKRKRVHKYILSGAEVLEDAGYIAGDAIPIVPYYGKRIFVDNIERFKGHVRDAKDPARVYNAEISKLVETASLSPRELPIFAPEQMDGLQEQWARINIDRHPYALAHPLLDPETGQIAQTGPLGYLKPPDLPPVLAALIQQMGNDIAEITNGDDTSMEVKSNVSAEAMDIAASRVDAKSFIYIDNFIQSMQRFGEIYYGMAKEVYVEEGREVQTMDEHGETKTATLAEMHVNNGGAAKTRHDLSVGKFNVVAAVTEATSTRRDKTVRAMNAIAEAAVNVQDMTLGQAALYTAVKNMDGEGLGDLQAFIHKKAVAIGLEDPTPEEQHAQAQQKPDPGTLATLAQAKALDAQANKITADTALSQAKTQETKTQAVLNLAKAKQSGMPAIPAADGEAMPQIPPQQAA